MSFAIFLFRNFYLKYSVFDTRTEIIEAQDNERTPPTLVMCANLYRELNCHNNLSLIGPTKSWCYSNAPYQRPLNPFPSSSVNDTSESIRNCVKVNAKLNDEFRSFIAAFWNGILSIHIIPHEFSNKLLDISYHSALPFYDSFAVSIINIERTIKKKRLRFPYESNCSLGKGIENFFSKSYDKQSCIQSCYMKEMFLKCNTVVDRWKPFMTDEMRRHKFVIKPEETRACLAHVLQKFLRNQIPNNCHCPLSCLEIDFEVSIDREYDAIMGDPNYENTFGIKFGYRYHRLKSITEFPAYTIYDFLSDVAGIVGMFMGMSSLSVIELLVLICIVVGKKTKKICRYHYREIDLLS